MNNYCEICGCGIMPGYNLCDVCGGQQGSKQVKTVVDCHSCAKWMPIKEHCGEQRTASQYAMQRFCNHWEEHPKYTIMCEKMDISVKVSKWNTKEHRRLELS